MPLGIQSNYKEVQARLKTVSPLAQKSLKRAGVVAVGEVVAEARARASWSAKIPPAIVPTATSTYVGVRVRGSKVPIATLNERRGGWRHPVFGNTNVWVPQRSRPSVKPAVNAHRAKVTAEMKVAMDVAIAEARFK